MIDKVTRKECYLCKGCSNICPVDAIDYSIEEKGFFYPKIDYSKCINCNLCEKACPVLNEIESPKNNYPVAYAVKSKSIDTRLNSTSGGVFFELGLYILNQGGSVCGTIFDNDFQVVHVITKEKSMLEKMRGSKYAQSDVKLVYREIKKLLNNGKIVLFCGCPCQTAALKLYIKKEYENLYIVDLICHGIPSQKFLDEYIKILEKKYKSKVIDIEFRNKMSGWHNSSVKINFENGKIYSKPIVIDTYMRGYFSGTTMKDSCYTCNVKNFHSGSDITIGDLWGAEINFPELDDNLRLSAVFVNSKKGNELLNKIDINKIKINNDSIIKYNRNVVESTMPNQNRNEFYKYCEKNGIGKALNDYFSETKKEYIKRKIKYQLKCIKNKIQGKDKPIY